MSKIQLVLFIAMCIGYGDSTTVQEQLATDVFSDYDADVPPLDDNTNIVNVKVGIAVNRIIDVLEESHVLRSSLWLRMNWNDARLSWDPANYSDMDSLVTTKPVWKPDVILYEDVRDEERVTSQFPVTIQSDGSISRAYIVAMRSNCKLNVIYFPFDLQRCTMTFGSASRAGYVILSALDASDAISTTLYATNGEWDLLSVGEQEYTQSLPCCPGMYFREVEFTINIKRRASFYMTNLIAPVILMSLLAVVGFLIPAESGEKASLSVTIYLSQVVFGIVIVGYLPVQSTGTPLLALYLLMVQVFMALSTVVNVVIVGVNFRGSHGHNVPRWMKEYIIFKLGIWMGLGNTIKKFRNNDEKVAAIKQEWSKAIKTTMHTNALFKRIREATSMREESKPGSDNLRKNNQKTSMKITDIESENHATPKGENGDINQKLLGELRKINAAHLEHDKEDLIRLEWALVSLILDRLLFLVFLFVALLLVLIVPITEAMAENE